MRTRYWVIGGVVVGGIILVATNPSPRSTASVPTHHHHKPRPKSQPHSKHTPTPKSKAPPIPKKSPTVPTSGSGSGSVTASFTHVVGQAPPLPLQVVTLPWQKGTQWAVEPLGVKMHGNSLTTLWFGDRTGTGPWQWIPTTLPGVPSSKLPPAIRESLTMAYSLHLGDSGPSQSIGNINWQGLQGHVADPTGWTLTTAGANSSPLFKPSVGITLFQKSYTGSFSGYYGMETAFDAQNASNGLHGLVGWVARTGHLSTIVKTPPPLL